MSKVLLATAIAMAAEVARRRIVRPQLTYALWGGVLAVLLIPSVVSIPLHLWIAATPERISSEILEFFNSENKGEAGGNGLMTYHILKNVFEQLSPTVVAPIWLLFGGLVFWNQVRRIRLLGLLVRFAAPVSKSVSKRCSAIAIELGISKGPTVVTASGTFSPFLWHPFIGNARIVIPDGLLDQLTDESIDMVLRHELIHLRRRDAWRHRAEALVVSIWWWFPIAWLARRRLLELEELCTDATLLRIHPNKARSYATALLDTDEFLAGQASPSDLVSAFAHCGSLKRRITRMLSDQPQPASRTAQGAICVAVAIMFALGFVTVNVTPSSTQETNPAHALGSTEKRVRSITEMAEPPILVETDRDVSKSPDIDSVTAHHSDVEILLTWPIDDFSKISRTIRLFRVSKDGALPTLWKIDRTFEQAAKVTGGAEPELRWMFTFLPPDSEILDDHGNRQGHSGSARLS